jgi:hypothetical protein
MTSVTNLTFSITAGLLPSGATLNPLTGVISGFSAVGTDTTSTFTVRVTLNSSYAERSFNITVKAPVTQVFSFSGTDYNFSIPAGMRYINVYMWGGAGGGAQAEGYTDPGGAGGYAQGLLNVVGMNNLIVQVGQGGGIDGGSPAGSLRPPRAYPNGGLPAIRNSYVSGGGGGRSAVFLGSVSFSNALIIAGGGGGAGGHGNGNNPGHGSQGGCGGGTQSENGYSSYLGTPAVNYATQTTSNDPSVVGTPAQAGGQLNGQDGGNGVLFDSGGTFAISLAHKLQAITPRAAEATATMVRT